MTEKRIAKIAVSAATYWTDRPYDYNVPAELADRVSPGMRVIVPFSRGNRKCEGVVLSVVNESPYGQLKTIISVVDEAPILTQAQMKLALWMRERFFCTVYDAIKAILPAGLWFDISAKLRIREGIDREAAYDAAGSASNQTKVLDVIFANGGQCERSQIEGAFGTVSPSKAIKELLQKEILDEITLEKRKVNDKTRDFAYLTVSLEDARTEAAARKRRAPTQASVLEFLAGVGRASVSEIKYFTGCTIQPVKALEKAGLLTIESEEVYRHKVTFDGELRPLPVLTQAQQAAFDGILDLANGNEAACALLLGVTGSGKTTV